MLNMVEECIFYVNTRRAFHPEPVGEWQTTAAFNLIGVQGQEGTLQNKPIGKGSEKGTERLKVME